MGYFSNMFTTKKLLGKRFPNARIIVKENQQKNFQVLVGDRVVFDKLVEGRDYDEQELVDSIYSIVGDP